MAMTITERIHEAEAELNLMKATENRRKTAEVCYIVARLYRDVGNIQAAKMRCCSVAVRNGCRKGGFLSHSRSRER